MKLLHGNIFYLVAGILLLIDVCCFALFEQQFLYPLLCFYIITLAQSQVPATRIIYLLTMLILQYFLYYGLFLPPLLYLAPITLISLGTKKLLYSSTMLCYGLLIASLAINYLLIEPYFFGTCPALGYTVLAIFANIVVMMLFSLK